jgi:pyridoxine 5-phosphate synthase
MTRLSVNINKIATLRNARGGNVPNVKLAAIKCQQFGAEGITVHPRPDERHIRFSDVYDLKEVVTTEFNIEGNPTETLMNLILEILPEQATLVPDAHDAVTSNAGWDTVKSQSFLRDIVSRLKESGVRASIFVGTDPRMIEYAALAGADRVELYTEPYASLYHENREVAIAPFVQAAKIARELNMGINAGHDLDLYNLGYLHSNIPWLAEVSIGHALISDALYFGLENTIQLYKKELKGH